MKAPELVIVRHAQHIPSEGNTLIDGIGLTCEGVAEARATGDRLMRNSCDIVRASSFNHIRALSTVALGLHPTVQIDGIIATIAETGIEINPELDYIAPQEGEFADSLLESYLNNRNFLFLATESDKYFRRDRPISSYSVMAAAAARLILNIPGSNNPQATALVCAREFITPSLVGKVIRYTDSRSSEEDYIDWYTDNMENKDKARTDLTSIYLKEYPGGKKGYILCDDNNEYGFNASLLYQIMEEGDSE